MRVKFLVVVLILAISIGMVCAVPELPMQLDGLVTIDGVPASRGTSILATGDGVLAGNDNNPVILPADGSWGDTAWDTKLLVQGNLSPSTPVYLHINGDPAKVRLYGGTTWSDYIPYESGSRYRVEVAIRPLSDEPVGPTPSPSPTPTPTPTLVPISEPTFEILPDPIPEFPSTFIIEGGLEPYTSEFPQLPRIIWSDGRIVGCIVWSSYGWVVFWV